MLIQLFDILGPIICITAIGYWLGRSTVEFETRTMGNAVVLVATPALIFSTLTSLKVSSETMAEMAGAAFLCVTIAGLLGLLVLIVTRAPIRSFLPPLMMPNSGNMGLPLVVLTFGEAGLPLGVAYFFVIALVQNTLGITIYAGSFRLSTLLRQPLIYAVLAVMVVTWTNVQVPQVVLTTTEILGGMMVPAMLLLLGASLATLKVEDLRPALLVAIGRLLIGIATAFAVINLLGLSGTVAGIVFIMATMPAAVLMFVYAERYQSNAKQVAGSIVVSTLLTFACLPALVWGAVEISGGKLGGEIDEIQSHSDFDEEGNMTREFSNSTFARPNDNFSTTMTTATKTRIPGGNDDVSKNDEI